MNSYFGRHAIVTIESTGSFVTLKTYDAQHGNSMRMYIDSDKLYRWIDSEAQSALLDHDCGSFTIMHRMSKETISVRLTWLHAIGNHNVKGYTQEFDLHADDLMAVLLTADRVRKLVALDEKPHQAQITITNGAHRQIRALKSIRPIKYNGGNDLAYYTYLKDVRYQVRAHFEWNMNRPELEGDRNENKHHETAKRMICRGGRRDVFLGTRECQAYVEPCVFGEGEGYYDELPQLSFGVMVHGITYPDEAYSQETQDKMTLRLWRPVMEKGVIHFIRPEQCAMQRIIKPMQMKKFGKSQENFAGLKEFGEVT